jgi:hypothetical protein
MLENIGEAAFVREISQTETKNSCCQIGSHISSERTAIGIRRPEGKTAGCVILVTRTRAERFVTRYQRGHPACGNLGVIVNAFL